MSGALWAISLLAFASSAVALAVGVASARRYRELRTALIATGVLTAPSAMGSNLPEESPLPAVDSPVPPGIRATSLDGTVIDSDYLATGELIVVFLMVT
ncbi:hypothetical protein, partial [Plantactinospora sp. CA-290183]|uniref:hypothetical protein n=1 Tax=Plantactinospora sp. CA-290183 TaxID=3240006 RepID=UPI003D8BF542